MHLTAGKREVFTMGESMITSFDGTKLYLKKETAAEQVLKHDKRRANYYKYHVGDKWANMKNYDLAIRSDFGGIDHAVDCIAAFLQK